MKKIINISYLIMVLIKMRLFIFLVLSRYELACKWRIISQMSIYNWMAELRLMIFLVLHFHISTSCDKSDCLPHDGLRGVSSVQIAILHRTSSGRQWNRKTRYGSKILTHSRVRTLGTLRMVHLEHDLSIVFYY